MKLSFLNYEMTFKSSKDDLGNQKNLKYAHSFDIVLSQKDYKRYSI